MMHLKGLMISQFLVVLVVKNSSALSCVPCYLLSGCPELKCLGGKVLGLCGCCYVCAKQLDELCGGLYGLIGTCDQGLHCVLPPQEVNETVTIIHHVGVCQAKTTPGPEATTQPAKTMARNEVTTQPAKPTLRNNTSTAQQDGVLKTGATLRQNTSTVQQDGVLKTGTTLRQNTSTVQQVSPGLSNTNTSPDPKLQNGVSAFLRTKGVDILCLIMSLCVLSHLK